MRYYLLCLALLINLTAYSQSLPIDFESNITTEDFVDFDGGTAAVIDNPHVSDENQSTKVARIVRDGGAVWAGSKIILGENLDFTTESIISMKVFTTAPIGTIVKFKLEGDGATEIDVTTTTSGEWETLEWDFTGQPTIFNEIVFMFDFGNTGNGGESSTFFFDDVEQLYSGQQIDLPVDFEGDDINYNMTDFGGNLSSLEMDPEDDENHVIKVIKTTEAATWAGTTIGRPTGFATNIPLTLTDSKMTVRVWSPEPNTPIRLKVEDWKDPTHTCETEVQTTETAAWEYLEFDFTNQAPGTESLAVGLQMGWTYNMASIFFNFGTEGVVAGEKTYYFDDVTFGELVLSDGLLNHQKPTIYPNPTSDYWSIKSKHSDILSVKLYDANGSMIMNLKPKSTFVELDASALLSGIYFCEYQTVNGSYNTKLIRY